MKQNILLFICLPTSTLLLFGLNLTTGSVQILFADVSGILRDRFTEKENWEYIILENRLPQTLAAIPYGASLSVYGLMLQTAFRSPLVGPDVFSISSGTDLGVALVMLLLGETVSTSIFTVSGSLATLTAAFVGAVTVATFILSPSTLVRNSVLSLIVGITVGYASFSAVSLLSFFASEEGVKSYMMRGMGNFGVVSMNHIPLFSILYLVDIVASFLLVKPLNILLLGPQYAESLRVSTCQIRNVLLVVVGLLIAITTALCDPISFIGLAIPHIARLLFRTENRQILLPGTVLSDAVTVLFYNFICYLPGKSGIIPLNAVTPLIGVPVIICIIVQRRQSDKLKRINDKVNQ